MSVWLTLIKSSHWGIGCTPKPVFLQVRNSRTESTEEDKRSDDSRPLSHASDFSRDNILSLSNAPRRSRRGIAPCSEAQRPLTRYLPVDRDDFDLRRHVESAGHQIEVCPYVSVTSTSCRGYLHKLGAKFHTWSKRLVPTLKIVAVQLVPPFRLRCGAKRR
ncbi:pleckstrin homology-like domain family B member 1 [Manduca sexta]|uniref:pleckstrin homology-like domain family B member 1 n=1 Tax=Manduca sexta TaxID=7130 RepID=UPI00188F5386|nr:pleckstrin homology-like domain family B member 1 [Manduca sexta]